MSKLVSVIIPFFNGVKWLEEAVESVLGQTYKNIEIIIVNDGSPENIQPFLDKYKEEIIYRYQENQGPAVARNVGMQLASGDYIAFDDADDIWMPKKLEKQISFMEDNGLEWSHTGWYNWWPESGKLRRVDNHLDYDDMYEQLKVSAYIATPSVVVSRKTMIEHPEIKFPAEFRKGEDTVYYKLLSKHYRLGLVHEPLVKVRMRNDNARKEYIRRFEMRAKAYKENKDDMSSVMRLNGILYLFFNWLFSGKGGKLWNNLAKYCYAIPYGLSRLYVRYLVLKNKKNNKYIW